MPKNTTPMPAREAILALEARIMPPAPTKEEADRMRAHFAEAAARGIEALAAVPEGLTAATDAADCAAQSFEGLADATRGGAL